VSVDLGETSEAAPAVANGTAVLAYLTRQLVDQPDAVSVEVVHERGRATLNVRVAPGDLGRVIGKRGRTANAIRTLVRSAAAVRDGVEVDVEFLD
jgi:predicted RNA-binding protein YlqC (UPF0109 family)